MEIMRTNKNIGTLKWSLPSSATEEISTLPTEAREILVRQVELHLTIFLNILISIVLLLQYAGGGLARLRLQEIQMVQAINAYITSLKQ